MGTRVNYRDGDGVTRHQNRLRRGKFLVVSLSTAGLAAIGSGGVLVATANNAAASTSNVVTVTANSSAFGGVDSPSITANVPDNFYDLDVKSATGEVQWYVTLAGGAPDTNGFNEIAHTGTISCGQNVTYQLLIVQTEGNPLAASGDVRLNGCSSPTSTPTAQCVTLTDSNVSQYGTLAWSSTQATVTLKTRDGGYCNDLVFSQVSYTLDNPPSTWPQTVKEVSSAKVGKSGLSASATVNATTCGQNDGYIGAGPKVGDKLTGSGKNYEASHKLLSEVFGGPNSWSLDKSCKPGPTPTPTPTVTSTSTPPTNTAPAAIPQGTQVPSATAAPICKNGFKTLAITLGNQGTVATDFDVLINGVLPAGQNSFSVSPGIPQTIEYTGSGVYTVVGYNNFTAGSWTLTAGPCTTAVLAVTVTPVKTTPPATLPFTGQQITPLALVAFGCLLTGGLMIGSSRRHHRRQYAGRHQVTTAG